MKKIALLIATAAALTGCVGVGHIHESCFYGIQVPFVAVGINGAPLGLCR